MRRRSGMQVMLKLVGLVKPLAGFMVLAILMGLAGHLCAASITVLGGYAVLDFVFDGAMEADLIVTPYTMKTEDGNVITGNTYAVQSVDEETGEIYSCKIKPSSDSSKSMLSMMFR